MMSIEKHRRTNLTEENKYRDELLEEHLSMGMSSVSNMQSNNMMVDSENISLDEKSESKATYKKHSEKSNVRSVDGSLDGQNMGPITRRKELQLQQSNDKNSYDKTPIELSSLKKFDEFYKDKKNVEHEMYLYRPPRISKELCQVTVKNIDTNSINCYNKKINNSEKFSIDDNTKNAQAKDGHTRSIPSYLIYDYSKISKDDLNYYLKFVDYYKENSSTSISGNIFLKGLHNFELNALKLLKECNYDINVALRKILFPVLDSIYVNEIKKNENNSYPLLENHNLYHLYPPSQNNGAPQKIISQHLQFNKSLANFANPLTTTDPMIYVNSALNDLIGSNIQEKEEWLSHVKERIESGITYEDLNILIELGGKMKIDIPDFIITEIENSLNYSRTVRRHLNEKNSLNDIINLIEKSQIYKVKTEEFSQLEEILKKGKNWLTKVEELENKTINYKTLQNLYQEAKALPINFDKFDWIKNRYLKAQKWQEKYAFLPKHSKTRQQGNSNCRKNNNTPTTERCTIAYLQLLIKECDEINFTSNDVVSLKNNFNKLRESEARIAMTLEDPTIIKTRELLIEFVNTLDSLKFTTELYDTVVNKLEYINWEENKNYYMGNKVLKMKHLRNLIKEATQKNLNSLIEIQEFKNVYDKIENWMYKMSNIFYSNDSDINDTEEEENSFAVGVGNIGSGDQGGQNFNNTNNANNTNLNANNSTINAISQKKKIELDDLLKLYEEGKSFSIKTEEVEHLLMKCEEFFEFINECKISNNSSSNSSSNSFNNSSSNSFNYSSNNYTFNLQKLSVLRKQISKYNIKCEEFDLIDNQIFQVQQWMEAFQEFIQKYNNPPKLNFKKINYPENRQETIEMLENFLRKNLIFYENLIDLINKVPLFAKSSKEFEELNRIREEAEVLMASTNTNNNSIKSTTTCMNAISNTISSSNLNNNKNNFLITTLTTNSTSSKEEIINSSSQIIYSFIPEKMELEELEKFLDAAHFLCVKKDFFGKLLCLYRAKSWAHVTYLKEKMFLQEAESMIKEATTINLQASEIEEMKKNILKTKEWVKQSKKLMLADEEISYDKIKQFIKDGAELPLNTPELKELINFQAMLEDEIFKARNFLLIDHTYTELVYFCDIIESYPINDVPEFEFILSLKKLCQEWKFIADKILSSRKLSILFFKMEMDAVDSKNNLIIDAEMKDITEEDEDEASASKNYNPNNLNLMTPNKKKNTDNKNSGIISNEEFKKINREQSFYNTIGNKIENTNINIITNNFYFEEAGNNSNSNSNLLVNANLNSTNNNYNNQSQQQLNTPTFLKKKHKRARKKDYDNVLNIVNNISKKNKNSSNSQIGYPINNTNLNTNPHNLNTNINYTPTKRKTTSPYSNTDSYLLTSDVKINSKKFENYSYEDKIKFLSKTVILKEENPEEKYCICRRGDDSLHYMLMCENCKEWFHGKCVKISKPNADKISQYLCIGCSRRKDTLSNNYHTDFHNLKRISFQKFLDFIKEGQNLPVRMEELEKLKIVLTIKIEIWLNNYENLLKKIVNIIQENMKNISGNIILKSQTHSNLKILDEAIEKNLLDLYHESEGLPVELEQATNIIIILKHYDWFKDAFKCLENRKFSEKINKKVICASFSIFNKDLITISSDTENEYFQIIIEKGLKFLAEITQNYDKYSSILNVFKNRFDKKNSATCEELIAQLENTSGKNTQYIINEIENYLSWVSSVKRALTSTVLFEENYEELVNKAKTFNFKTALLEKFRRIYLNPLKQSVNYYRSLLFPENEKKKKIDLIMQVEKVKREKKVKEKEYSTSKAKENLNRNNVANNSVLVDNDDVVERYPVDSD